MTDRSRPSRGRLAPIRDQAVARNLERVAWLMDRAVTIPGTRITVGLDALLGLLPVGGDVLTGVVQTAPGTRRTPNQYKVSKAVAAKMMTNVLIDVAVGSIPILGDLFDVGFRKCEHAQHQAFAAVWPSGSTSRRPHITGITIPVMVHPKLARRLPGG